MFSYRQVLAILLGHLQQRERYIRGCPRPQIRRPPTTGKGPPIRPQTRLESIQELNFRLCIETKIQL